LKKALRITGKREAAPLSDAKTRRDEPSPPALPAQRREEAGSPYITRALRGVREACRACAAARRQPPPCDGCTLKDICAAEQARESDGDT